MGSRLTLKTTPPERLVLASWAMPSLEGLDAAETKRFYSLKEAITDYVHGSRITQLLQAKSIWREVFYRAYDKCVALDGRGMPIGWVGLLPYLEIQPRQRRKPLPKHQSKGLAGALAQFLRQNSDIAAALESYLLLNAKRKPGGEAGVRHKSVHMEFLRLCEAKDPDMQSWPFTSRRRGATAVRGSPRPF